MVIDPAFLDLDTPTCTSPVLPGAAGDTTLTDPLDADPSASPPERPTDPPCAWSDEDAPARIVTSAPDWSPPDAPAWIRTGPDVAAPCWLPELMTTLPDAPVRRAFPVWSTAAPVAPFSVAPTFACVSRRTLPLLLALPPPERMWTAPPAELSAAAPALTAIDPARPPPLLDAADTCTSPVLDCDDDPVDTRIEPARPSSVEPVRTLTRPLAPRPPTASTVAILIDPDRAKEALPLSSNTPPLRLPPRLAAPPVISSEPAWSPAPAATRTFPPVPRRCMEAPTCNAMSPEAPPFVPPVRTDSIPLVLPSAV